MELTNEDAPVFETWEDVTDRIGEIFESELQEMDEIYLATRYPNWGAVRDSVDLLGDGAFDMGVAEGDLLDSQGWLDRTMETLRPDFEDLVKRVRERARQEELDYIEEWADSFFIGGIGNMDRYIVTYAAPDHTLHTKICNGESGIIDLSQLPKGAVVERAVICCTDDPYWDGDS